jgi:energy-coupling factor transporter ATP-binding protein EcfA2
MVSAPSIVDEYTQLLNDKEGFMLAIIGKPGAGKSTLIKQLLTTTLKGQFNYVFVMSPSADEYAKLIPDVQMTSDFSIPWITKMVNMVNVVSDSAKKQKAVNALLIIDDNVARIREQDKKSCVTKLFFNRRHMLWYGSLSIIMTSQKYTMIPAKYRSCITHLSMFGISPFDVDKIFAESIISYTKVQWKEAIAKLYQTQYTNILLNLQTQRITMISPT